MILIVVSYGCFINIVGGVVWMLMKSEVDRALNRRRMTHGIDAAIVIGHP